MSDSRLLMSGQMSHWRDIDDVDRTLKVSIEDLCGIVTHIQMEKWLAIAHECPGKIAKKTVVNDEHTIINTDS